MAMNPDRDCGPCCVTFMKRGGVWVIRLSRDDQHEIQTKTCDDPDEAIAEARAWMLVHSMQRNLEG
jgi:hypothetical protein